jgi:hypothetical protein
MHKFFASAFVVILIFATQVELANAVLTCSITTAAACTSPSVIIYRMSSATNAHAAMPTSTAPALYNNVVCCSSPTSGLNNVCSATSTVALYLKAGTNSHVSQTNIAPYTTPACISSPNETVTVGYQAADCSGYDTTLGSMIGTKNSHIGNPAWTAGTTKICAKAGVANKAATSTLTSAVFDTGVVSGVGYNSIMWNGTLPGGKVRFQLAAANSSAGPWSYIGGNTCGAFDWFDPLAPNTPIELKGASCVSAWNNMRYFRYKVQLCSNDCITAGPNTPTVNGIVVNYAS